MVKWKQAAILMFAVTLVSSATACSSKSDSGSNNGASGDAVDASGKYDPPITVTAARGQPGSMKFEEGDDFEHNAYNKAYLDQLGIELNYDWVVPEDQYDTKLNIAISSNDLPDIFKVNASQLQQLVEAGRVADLTDAYNKYADDLAKQSIEMGPLSKAAATFDGKLMALSPDENYDAKLMLLYLRTDWLKKLNLEPPKTLAELENIMRAFKTQDPDGNGKDDTFGIALSKELYNDWVGDAKGIFDAFHAYPDLWIEGPDGKLVFGGIQPEVRAALAKMQEWYKEGLIDREFGVKDSNKLAEDIAAGKIGVQYGALWTPLWPLQDNVNADKNADWMAYHSVSADDKPVKYGINLEFNNFYVANKDMKHPEALIKLFNLGNELINGGEADPDIYGTEVVGDNKFEHFFEAVIQGIGGDPKGGNYQMYKVVSSALAANDPSKLTVDEQGTYEGIESFNKGDRALWGNARVFGIDSSYKIIDEAYKDKDANIQFTKFYGAPTKTMVEKKATLDKMQLEVFTKIILGQPIETFDQYVADWKKLGGDKMTEEVNAWYENNK